MVVWHMRIPAAIFVALAGCLGGMLASGTREEVRARSFVLENERGEAACRMQTVDGRVSIRFVQSGLQIVEASPGALSLEGLGNDDDGGLRLEVVEGGVAVSLTCNRSVVKMAAGEKTGSGVKVQARNGGEEVWVGESGGVCGLRAASKTGERVVMTAAEDGAELALGAGDDRVLGMRTKEGGSGIIMEHGDALWKVRAAPRASAVEWMMGIRSDNASLARIATTSDGAALLLRSGSEKSLEGVATRDEAGIEILSNIEDRQSKAEIRLDSQGDVHTSGLGRAK